MLSFFYMWGSFAGPVLAGLFVLLLIATLLNAWVINPWRKKMLEAQTAGRG